MSQYARPPNLSRPCGFKNAVPGRVAFDAYRVKAGAWIFDGEIETESAPVIRLDGWPSLAAKKLLHGIAESVAFISERVAIDCSLGC